MGFRQALGAVLLCSFITGAFGETVPPMREAALAPAIVTPTETRPVQPGQITANPMRLEGFAVSPTHDAIVSIPVIDRHDLAMRRLWIASIVAMVAASSTDAATSWGKREGNGFLASSNGNFGMRGVSLKAAMAGAVIVPQLLFRNHKNLRGKFIAGNFIEAGIFTGVSVHNLRVTAASH